MKKLIRKYKELSFEQKTIYKTVIGLCFSAVLVCGKLVIGLFTDYNLISIAVYTFGILLAKLECVLGVKTNRLTFKQRNILTAFFSLYRVFCISDLCAECFLSSGTSKIRVWCMYCYLRLFLLSNSVLP